MPKNVKGDPFGFFDHPFCFKIEKNEGELLETLGKFAKKSLTITMHKKILVKGETRTHVILLARPQKIPINLYAQFTLVCQLKESSL